VLGRETVDRAPLISVCILAGHGAAALESCLESLRGQLSPPPFELLIGGSPSPEAVSLLARHFPAALLCWTEGYLPGAARNSLIEQARGELLLFLDDDVTAPPDLLHGLAQVAADHPDASVFGGPNDTPFDSSRFQAVQGAVLGSLMGSGPVSRRYGARHPGPADERWFTLCNLAVRRRAMLPFASELVCAEENALLAQLRRDGQQMRYEPSLRVFHARRPTLRSFAKQMFKYGRGRGQLLARRPTTLRLAYALPTLLLAYLRAFAHGWRIQRQAENITEIATAGRKLYESVGVFVEHLREVGRALNRVVSSYNNAVGSFRGRIAPRSREIALLANLQDDHSQRLPLEVRAEVERIESLAASEMPETEPANPFE